MTVRLLALVGPTAVGKSAAAVEVAEAIGAEIVSVDSMQLYRGMDVGTDKPSPELRERVPHHLLDVFEPSHEVTVEDFQRLARAAIDDISARGRLPLLVGGSGLYFRAVVDDLRFPPRSPELRAELEERAARAGAEVLWRRLAELDPEAAARIHPANLRRTVRALEAIELSGRPFPAGRAWDDYVSLYELRAAGLTRPRAELYERIARRVEMMFERGLIAEAERVAAAGPSRSAAQALGYRQVLELRGAAPDAIAGVVVRATKRFARRQESWFKADPRIVWFDARRQDLISALCAFFTGPATNRPAEQVPCRQ